MTIQLPAGCRIEAKAASAELRGAERLGDVSIGRLGGPAQISTQKGDLRIAEAVRGTVTPRTEHGEIAVGAARGVSASLNAGTTHGQRTPTTPPPT